MQTPFEPLKAGERRLHPVALLFNLAEEVKQFAVPTAAVVFSADGWKGLLWGAAVMAIGAAVAIGRYLTFSYRYGDTELIIRSGLFFKEERHIPYSRIQNVDTRQNLLQRALGVQAVVLDTAAGGTPEADFSALPDSAVAEMRRWVFAAPRATPEAGTAASDAVVAPEETLLELDLRELVIAGLVRGRGWLVVAAVFTALGEWGVFERFVERAIGNEKNAGPIQTFVLRFVSDGSWKFVELLAFLVSLIVALVLLVLFLRVLSVIATVIRLYGFVLRQSNDELRMTYGLLTRVRAALPVRRIQTLTIREGPLHRLFTRSSLRADTAGGEVVPQARGGREWLAPIAPPGDVTALAMRFLPGLSLAAPAWQKPHAKAARRIFIRALMFVALAAPVLAWWIRAAAVPVVALLLVLAFVHARLSAKHMAFALSGEMVLFKSGWLWRHVTIAPLEKVQAVSVRQTPFDRRHGMARLVVDTAGAQGSPHRLDLRYLALQDAQSLAEVATGRAAASNFRW